MVQLRDLVKQIFVITGLLFLFIIIPQIVPSSNSTISNNQSNAIIADHTVVNIVRFDQIPESVIIEAKNTLHIAYGHTSHGSQVISGMTALPAFKENAEGTPRLYAWNEGGTNGSLDIDDYFMTGDLGNPDRETWANRTRTYLDNPDHADGNVVMWSWCGQASTSDPNHIQTYLNLMTGLENDYPNVIFVYMTGHTDGTGLEGHLHQRNTEIRNHCTNNGKVLFDFADIESYDPDSNYYGEMYVDDECDYHNDTYAGNWADEWTAAHEDEVFDCGCAHSKALNCNMKAYAAWWLWARLTGWEIDTTSSTPSSETNEMSSEATTTATSSQTLTTTTIATQTNGTTNDTATSAPTLLVILIGVSAILTFRKRLN